MRFFTRFSLQNPVAVFILALLIAVGGVLSALGLHEELMPDVDFPVIAVVTPYPGASPEQVASDVSEPLEKALNGVQDVKNITSISEANVSEIEVELNLNADLSAAEQKVREIVNQVQLPSSALKPVVQKFSFNASPVVYFTVASSNGNLAQLRQAVNNTIVPALQGVSGVASVQLGGAAPDQVSIRFDPDKLRAHHLTLQQAIQDLQAANVTEPLGTAVIGGKEQPVQLSGAPKTLNDLRNLRLPVPADPTAGMNAALSSLNSVGQTMGRLADGMGQLGQGLGVVEAQNRLLSALVHVQGQLFGAEMALAQQAAKPPALQDPRAMAELQGQIQALQRTQAQLQQQLAALQSKFPSASAGAAAAPPPAVASPAGPRTQKSTLDTVKLSDVADVSLTQPTDHSINRTNGQPSVFVGVVKTEDANTVDMANAVNAKLSELQKQLPKAVHIVPLFDSSQMIKASVGGMVREAVLGAVFAVVVILLFLRNWRTTLIAVVSIPLSLLTAIILLKQLGITMNIMTLGGMAVATGRVVDDSIVVIENIHRQWRRGAGSGKPLVQLATAEVGQAITASTLTTVAVFLPLGLVSGLVGKIFYPFALTVVCSLLSSLLVALTVVPVLAWLLVTRRPVRPADALSLEGEPALASAGIEQAAALEDPHGAATELRPWQRRYQRILNACLNHKGWVLTVTTAAFVASVLVLPLAGSTFIPESKEKFATVSITMPIGTPLAATDAKARQVEQVVHSFGATVEQMNTKVGSDPGQVSESGTVSGSNQASLFLELRPETDVAQFTQQLRSKLTAVAGPATIQVKEVVLGGSGQGFDVVLTGGTPVQLREAAQRVTQALQNLPGLANVQNNLAQTRSEVVVTPDAAKAAQYGLTAYQIGTLANAAISNQKIGSVNLDGQSYDLRVSIKTPAGVNSLQAIEDLPIDTPTGKTVRLGDVATVRSVQTPVTVLHQNGQPFAEISGDFTSNNTGRTTAEALRRIQSLGLPSDIQVQLSGASQQQNQSFAQLIEAIVIAVGLVYIVMLIAFGEWSAPFAILFSMPVALIGAFFGTVIGHQPVSVSSLIGILMLMGIVVTNAIVLVDRVEQQRRRGLTIREALLEAGTTRLRPILMTAIATICALFPLALGFAEGALISQGLAVVVIGGLVTSTVLTLVIVPVVYELLHRRTVRRERAVAG